MARDRVNSRYLPGVELPDGLEIEHDFARAVTGADQLLVVVPSHAFREVLERIRPLLRAGQGVAWATKGFELATGKLPHDVAAEVLGPGVPTAVLSGPTFAKEVGAGLPSAMTVASRDGDYAMALARSISERELPRLRLGRHDRRRGRRRHQERARDRRRRLRRSRLRREHARRAHHARPRPR